MNCRYGFACASAALGLFISTGSLAEEPAAVGTPVFDGYSFKVDRNSLVITGRTLDPEADQTKVESSTEHNGKRVTLCVGTSSFTCTHDISGFGPGTYPVTLTVIDVKGQFTQETFNFNIAAAPRCFTAKNTAHIAAARAYPYLFFWFPKAYANGSNDDLGFAALWFDETTSLKEAAADYWVRVSSCP